MSERQDLLSRDEVLGGLPARRARSLTFLIERQTVRHSTEREVGPMALIGEGAARGRELAWIEAFASAGEEEIRRPSIQEVESAAESWADLVPEAPAVRAAAARLLAERYQLDPRHLKRTRVALGLDDERVAKAYERQTGEPIASLWTRPGPLERLRWLAAAPGRWLERTPPFWAAAALTFLLSLGQTIIIIPIAVASVGAPVAAISILVVGLFALSATAATAEATARNGEVRLRGGFFGRLVTSALGGPAGSVPSLLGIAGVVLPTLSTLIGLALLLELTIPLPAIAWVAVLGAIGVAIPLKRPRSASFGGLMAFGLLSAALLAALSALVLVEAAVGGDLVTPPLSPPNDIGVDLALGVIIGVLLGSYADPVYTVQIGRLVLPRDEDGSGYIRGTAAGMAAFVVLTVLFSAVLLFVVPAEELAGQAGSALDPLAERFGLEALVLATLIGVGLFGIRLYGNSIALFDFVDERLPGRPPPHVILRAGQGRVLLAESDERGVPALTLAYRGLRDNRPVIALAGSAAGPSSERSLKRTGGGETIAIGGTVVGLEVLEADDEILRIALRTQLTISYDGDVTASGPGVAESLLAGDVGAQLAAWLLRERGGTAAGAAAEFGWSQEEARAQLESLVEAGRADAEEGGRFKARLGTRRRRGLDEAVWGRLGAGEEQPDARPAGAIPSDGGIWTRVLRSPVARAIVSSIPNVALALFAAVLIAAGTASVSGPIRIVGVVAFATIAGVLPPMLLLAARRRSDVTGASGGGILVAPVLLALTGIAAFGVLILHATILWSDPVERAVAAIAAVFAVAAVVLAWRHGSFRPTVLVELRQQGEGKPAILRAEESGRPMRAEITIAGRALAEEGLELELEEGLELTIEGHPAQASELRVSAQLLDSEGIASALPVSAELVRGGGPPTPGQAPVRLDETGGIAAFETAGKWTLRIDPDRGSTPDSPLDRL